MMVEKPKPNPVNLVKEIYRKIAEIRINLFSLLDVKTVFPKESCPRIQKN
jgi:hypothetical protein